MSNKNNAEQDRMVLHELLVDHPAGLAAVHRMDRRCTQLALALKAHVTFLNVRDRLDARQCRITQQVLRVAQGQALEEAEQIAEHVLRARMLDGGLDPNSKEDRKKFAHQLGKTIMVSEA